MKKVIAILNQVAQTSSVKEKEKILRDNKENQLLEQVLYYTLNPYLKYKMTEKTICPIENENKEEVSIFSLLDILASYNINDTLKNRVNTFLGSVKDLEERQLYINMIKKDLKIKCNAKTVNKVWDSLIPSFGVMLAESYYNYQDRLVGKSFSVTMKMDGHRCVAIKENGQVKLFTKQGHLYEGLLEIEEVVNGLDADNIVIDGELLVQNYKEINPKDRYKATSKKIRVKGEKRGVTLVAFDLIPLDEFRNSEGNTSYSTRRETLEKLVEKTNSPFLEAVQKLYQGNDTSIVQKTLDEVTSRGEEGLMINFDDTPYKTVRTTNILKVKKMLTADVRVVDVYEGEKGKEFEGTLGGVTIEFIHNNEVYRCNCGSGFKVSDRDKYWKNPDLIIGKIIEINYFEVTSNSNGSFGLRFAIFKQIREDKLEISMR